MSGKYNSIGLWSTGHTVFEFSIDLKSPKKAMVFAKDFNFQLYQELSECDIKHTRGAYFARTWLGYCLRRGWFPMLGAVEGTKIHIRATDRRRLPDRSLMHRSRAHHIQYLPKTEDHVGDSL